MIVSAHMIITKYVCHMHVHYYVYYIAIGLYADSPTFFAKFLLPKQLSIIFVKHYLCQTLWYFKYVYT